MSKIENTKLPFEGRDLEQEYLDSLKPRQTKIYSKEEKAKMLEDWNNGWTAKTELPK